jgi:tight adherence protein B
MDPVILSLIVFVAVVAMVSALAYVFTNVDSTKAEDRLDVFTGQKSVAGSANNSIVKEELIREGMGGLSVVFNKLVKKLSNTRQFFEQADSPIRVDTFFIISMVLFGIGMLLAWIGRAPTPLYPVVGLCVGILPLGWLWMRRGRRLNKFAVQLPDALELIARALRSGHSLGSGLTVVVQEMPDPTSQEFGIACEEQNLGIPIEQTLQNMLKRIPNMDLQFFVTAVVIQKQAGGDMAEILEKIGKIVRDRFRIMGQVKALTGEGRISGVVLMALPIALFFAVYYLNQEYIMLLFTEELGRKMIAVAAFLQILGAVCINKIVKIKI